jgi:hypothetical protein
MVEGEATHLKRIIAAILCLAGCASTTETPELRPRVDLSPVGCGYKWFQSGYGPTISISCDQDRSPLRDTHRALARTHAWEIARKRCPDACRPITLKDSIDQEDRFPDGVCRSGYAYFSVRVFFQCGE